MEQFDRREFLARAGGVAVTAGTIGVGPAFAGWSSSGGQPLRELARTLDGTVVARADAAYAHARLLVSTRFDAVHPQAVVFCETVADVHKTVRWARRHHVHVVPRSGGHSYGGYSTTPGAGRHRLAVFDRVAVGAGEASRRRLAEVRTARARRAVLDLQPERVRAGRHHACRRIRPVLWLRKPASLPDRTAREHRRADEG